MIHLEMMTALLDALPADARIVLLGDKDQLASVEAGAVLGELCRDAGSGRYRADTAAFVEAVTGQRMPSDPVQGGSALDQQTVMLRESRRFGGPIARLAQAVNAGDAPGATALLQATADSSIEWHDARSPAIVVQLALRGRIGAEGGYGTYIDQMRQRPNAGERGAFDAWVMSVLRDFDRFRVLCAVREGDWGAMPLNQAIESALQAKGLIAACGEWYEGRPVMVTRNDAAAGVFNGDIGIVLGTEGGDAAPRAYFLDGPSVRSVSVGRLPHVETAFALTVHKAQGSEFEHSVLVLPSQASRVLTRELVYTGVTRARTAFTLVTGRPQAFTESLARRTRRSSGLADLVGDHGG
jgi:exodeoxyribonuclease V alpha subunit